MKKQTYDLEEWLFKYSVRIIKMLKTYSCPVFIALSKRALPMYLFEEMQYTGKRLTAQEYEAHHIIMKACHLDDLMDEMLTFAKA